MFVRKRVASHACVTLSDIERVSLGLVNGSLPGW